MLSCIIGNWLTWFALVVAGIEEEGEAGLLIAGGGGQVGGFWGGVEMIGVDSGAGAEEMDACEEEREQNGLGESKERRDVCVETPEVCTEREEGERKGLGEAKREKGRCTWRQ